MAAFSLEDVDLPPFLFIGRLQALCRSLVLSILLMIYFAVVLFR